MSPARLTCFSGLVRGKVWDRIYLFLQQMWNLSNYHIGYQNLLKTTSEVVEIFSDENFRNPCLMNWLVPDNEGKQAWSAGCLGERSPRLVALPSMIEWRRLT